MCVFYETHSIYVIQLKHFISPHFYCMGNLERTKQYLLVARQRVIIHKTFSKKYQASSSFPEPQLSREPREAGGRAEKTTEGVL
jgi:hypothetical protein